MDRKFILDVTAGYREMWYNKKHPNTIYLDINPECKPDIVGDFRDLKQFKDKSFKLIVFDPPHQSGKAQTGWLAKKYGKLNFNTIHKDFYTTFKELYRVLEDYGILIFKWSTAQIRKERILALADNWKPLFGQKTAYKTKHSSSTYWFCFMKIPKEEIENKVK